MVISRLSEFEPLAPHGCTLAVVMDPSLPASTTDTDDWYTIWGYAVAIQGMCVRHGFAGSIGGAGQYYLFLLRALPCNYSLITNQATIWILLCGCLSTMTGSQLC